jgi:hypothetical protein
MLGEFAALDSPNVDRRKADFSPRRRDALHGATMGCRERRSGGDLVVIDDAVVDMHLNVGPRINDALKIRNLCGEARGASTGMLDVSFGKDRHERLSIVRVHGDDIAIEQCRKRGAIGQWWAHVGRESCADRYEQRNGDESGA